MWRSFECSEKDDEIAVLQARVQELRAQNRILREQIPANIVRHDVGPDPEDEERGGVEWDSPICLDSE